jgi:hypothetical protein
MIAEENLVEGDLPFEGGKHQTRTCFGFGSRVENITNPINRKQDLLQVLPELYQTQQGPVILPESI